MKKITLIAFSFATTMAFAQLTGTPSGVTDLNSEQAVILEQTEDGANTIVSCTNTNETATVLCADDFTIGALTRIDQITIRGTVNNGLVSNITGWDLYIFNDNAGTPNEDPANTAGAPLIIQNANGAGITVVDDGVTAVDVTFDIATLNGGDLDLAAGTYWVSAGPIMTITDITDNTGATGERYNWDSSSDLNGAEPHLIDVNDTFGGGFITFTPFSGLGVSVGALAFLVEGEVLGVDDNLLSQISVFPNPASDVLNVKIPAGVDIQSVQLYDVLGKVVGNTIVNNEINISNLSRGVYILNMTTSVGTFTEKIVKR